MVPIIVEAAACRAFHIKSLVKFPSLYVQTENNLNNYVPTKDLHSMWFGVVLKVCVSSLYRVGGVIEC